MLTDASGTDQLSAWCLNWLVHNAGTQYTLEISESKICSRGKEAREGKGLRCSPTLWSISYECIGNSSVALLSGPPTFFIISLPPFRNGDNTSQILQSPST